MAIRSKDKVEYEGAVLRIDEHMWMDGMLEVTATVWDIEKHETRQMQVGYYGADGYNLCRTSAEIDISKEVARDIIRTLKQRAAKAFADSVIAEKKAIRSGRNVEVIKGRKVPKGTKLEVFWVGERPTYQAMHSSWNTDTERIAGCFNEQGEKVWIKENYLKVTDKFKSPNATERKKFVKDWVKRKAEYYNIEYR